MNIAANLASTLPPTINFIPLPSTECVCGNCSDWKGPRERNGRKSFICMEGTQGACQRRMRNQAVECNARTLTSPFSNSGCPHWKFAAH